jgi:hypothetical protein
MSTAKRKSSYDRGYAYARQAKSDQLTQRYKLTTKQKKRVTKKNPNSFAAMFRGPAPKRKKRK